MTRSNVFRSKAVRRTTSAPDSSAGTNNRFENHTGILIFAGLLLVCSLAVGCSSKKPNSESSTNKTSIAQATPPAALNVPSTPATSEVPAATKPVHKKVVHRAPVTVTYEDKTSGVSLQYPRKYVLKTGDAAGELVSSSLVPMDFAQPGGAVTAAIAIPEGVYPKSDLVSAMFNVSMNKSLTDEQCSEFSTLQPDPATSANGPAPTAPTSKLILGDMQLASTEMMGSTDTRKETSKYYHVFENGACYEFALKVATTGAEPDEGGKAVDRDEVFKRLEKILATVKISPVEVDKQAVSATAAAPVTAAQ